jgi:hypothetical protein
MLFYYTQHMIRKQMKSNSDGEKSAESDEEA